MKSVAIAIIMRENRVFVARRANIEKLLGYWEFPGGKVEEGETLQQCLDRELNEELGIITKSGEVITKTIFEYEHGAFEIVALKCEIISGDIELRVHDKIEWVEVDRLLELNLLPADVEIAEYLITNSKY